MGGLVFMLLLFIAIILGIAYLPMLYIKKYTANSPHKKALNIIIFIFLFLVFFALASYLILSNINFGR